MLETNFDGSKSLFDASVQSLSVKCNKLEWDGKTYHWTGNLEELKDFIRNDMKLSCAWSSPGGDSKLFKAADEFSVKWHGRKSKKIVIVKDNDAELLAEMFKEHASILPTVDLQVNNTSKNQTYNITPEKADDYSGMLFTNLFNNQSGLVENAGTRICGYAGMRVCGYADMRVCGYADMRICGYADMWVCGYADMRVCGYARMRVCGYAGMRICGYAGTSNWFNKQISKTH